MPGAFQSFVNFIKCAKAQAEADSSDARPPAPMINTDLPHKDNKDPPSTANSVGVTTSQTSSLPSSAFGETPNSQAVSPKSPPISPQLSQRCKGLLRYQASKAKLNVSQRFEKGNKVDTSFFWKILMLTAALSSLNSFVIDETTWSIGLIRESYTTTKQGGLDLFGVCCFNIAVVLLARLIVRTTPQAEGSGFPEVKAMLFGKPMQAFLTLRVLFLKAIALSLGVGAGMPLGKEGPNVHMAACISNTLGPQFFSVQTDKLRKDQGARTSVQASNLLLAACAVGVGASFSAPIGGVVFSLELVLPQVFDSRGYWGCFLCSVTGSICYAAYRSVLDPLVKGVSSATDLKPLMSTNVEPGEGAITNYPMGILFFYACVGLLCGALGGLWIRLHAISVGALKRWRMRNIVKGVDEGGASTKRRQQRGSLYDSLLEPSTKKFRVSRLSVSEAFQDKRDSLTNSFRKVASKTPEWKDLVQIAITVWLNTVLAASLPLLGGKPQPLLMSTLFDKKLVIDSDTWAFVSVGPLATMLFCFLMKWTMTIFALSMPFPAGVVAPTMIIGGLLGRCVGLCLPNFFIDMLLQCDPCSDEERGAFMARIAIVAAAAFCAAVCRAFAMAITVFEVLALPNAILPLCTASLCAMAVADRIALPYFDTNLVGRGLGGISALTHGTRAMQPAFQVMRRLHIKHDCVEQHTTVKQLRDFLETCAEDFVPIVMPSGEHWTDEGVTGIIRGSIMKEGLDTILMKESFRKDDHVIDLLAPALIHPTDRSEPLVSCTPQCVQPGTLVQEVYLIMKISKAAVVYVAEDNCLLGFLSFKELLGHSKHTL